MLSTLVGALLPDLGSAIKKIIDNKFPNLEETERQRMSDEFQLSIAQIKVNEQEAAHPSLFVAGWRPAGGWICVFAIGVYGLVFPVYMMVFPDRPIPDIAVEVFFGMLMGMMGMGGIRSFDKKAGVARNSWAPNIFNPFKKTKQEQ